MGIVPGCVPRISLAVCESWVQTPATPLVSGACSLVSVPRIYVEAGHVVAVSLLQCPCLWCT